MPFFPKLTRTNPYEKKNDGEYFTYSRYRKVIAIDCQSRCVYCGCHEDWVGGLAAMETDHFRPWQKKFGKAQEQLFLALKNEPTNLVHACAVCNGFKLAHWPTEDPAKAYDHEKGWIEPFEEDRSQFLSVSNDGEMEALKPPAKYQIAQLRLNRPFAKRLRQRHLLQIQTKAWIEEKRPIIVAALQAADDNSRAALEMGLLSMDLLAAQLDSIG